MIPLSKRKFTSVLIFSWYYFGKFHFSFKLSISSKLLNILTYIYFKFFYVILISFIYRFMVFTILLFKCVCFQSQIFLNESLIFGWSSLFYVIFIALISIFKLLFLFLEYTMSFVFWICFTWIYIAFMLIHCLFCLYVFWVQMSKYFLV